MAANNQDAKELGDVIQAMKDIESRTNQTEWYTKSDSTRANSEQECLHWDDIVKESKQQRESRLSILSDAENRETESVVSSGSENTTGDLGSERKTSRNRERRKRQRQRTKEEKKSLDSETNEQPQANDWTSDMSEEYLVFRYILREHSGCCTLRQLSQAVILTKQTHVINWILNHGEHFRLLLSKDDVMKSLVKVYHSGMRICFRYTTECQNPKCMFIHLCRDFVAGSCSKSHCKYSHSLLDVHNSRLLQKRGLDRLPDDIQQCLVSCSNLQVCPDYNEDTCLNNGHNGSLCPKVHICEKFIRNICPFSYQYCKYCHSLDTSETRQLLTIYRMDRTDEQIILKSLLVCKPSIHVDPNLEDNIFQYLLDNKGFCKVAQVKAAGLYPVGFDFVKWVLKHDARFKLIPCSTVPEESIVKVFHGGLRLCFKYSSGCGNPSCQYIHLCKAYLAGCCTRQNCKYSHSLQDDHNKRLLRKKGLGRWDIDQQMCIISSSLPQVCKEYNETSCPNEGKDLTCHRVHICDKYVMRKCEGCTLNHTLDTPASNKLLQMYKLDKLPESTARQLLMVDTSYATSNNFKSHKVKAVNVAVAARKKPQNVKPPQSERTDEKQTNVHKDKETWICENFLRKKCTKGFKCEFHHFLLPYLWQAKQGSEWSPIRNNTEKEMDFSNPAKQFNLHFNCLDDQLEGAELEPIAYCVNLRRLSTQSYLSYNTEQGLFHTVWYWQWLDNGDIWRLYELMDGVPPYQDVIEATFLGFQRKDPNCEYLYFETGNFKYRIDFRNFTQENLTTKKQRSVQRRPAFVSEEDVLLGRGPMKPRQHFNSKTLNNFKSCPWKWAPMDTISSCSHQRVLISDRTDEHEKITNSFYATMDNARFVIEQIFRIQNSQLYSNYERKKRELMLKSKDLGSLVIEKQLFHGTPDEIAVKCIANQCFDPRMHGKHGTRYGSGAYFARDASYSNNYTDRSRVGIQYMFVARVLVGKSTLGDSSYKRPPPVDPTRPHGELYDSCINDVANPSIYVVFERDQCYPEILIEYREIRDASTSGLKTTTSTGNMSSVRPKAPIPMSSTPATRPVTPASYRSAPSVSSMSVPASSASSSSTSSSQSVHFRGSSSTSYTQSTSPSLASQQPSHHHQSTTPTSSSTYSAGGTTNARTAPVPPVPPPKKESNCNVM